MLVIHPTDRTTSMLEALYRDIDAQVITDDQPTKAIGRLLNHVPTRERIMLLGHGSDKGLFYRKDDTQPEFDRLIVSHSHGFQLRRHGANLVGIWCCANLFAQAEGLHGLFSGMIISEMSEAALYGFTTTQAELDRENVKLAERLRRLLDERTPLDRIPDRMRELDDIRSPITCFNYAHFYYL